MFFTQISQIARIIPHGCARGGVCHTDSTDFSASRCLQGLARTYSPCPAGRDLVDLINLFLRDSVRVRGQFRSSRFLYGIAGCARWMGFSLARGVTQISQIPQIISHRCARGGGVWHTEITEFTVIIALLRSRFFLCHTDYTDITDYFASLRSRWALGGIN